MGLKTFLLILIIGLSSGVTLGAQYRFIDASSGKQVSLEKLAAKLARYNVVFFGEYHDNAAIHQAQRDLLPHLYARDKRLTLSFEMFERDVQPLLNSYLKDEISEAAFLAEARPWPNYETDYKTLVEFAKSNGLDALAANVPRRLAGMAVRAGKDFISTLDEQDRSYVAKEINAWEGPYKENFLQTMAENAAHGGQMDAAFYDNMYLAQCVKDDTMAESLVDYWKRHPRQTILHFNGDFHSRGFLGTVERALSRAPRLKVAVISPLYGSADLPTRETRIANYFLVVPDPPESEHSE